MVEKPGLGRALEEVLQLAAVSKIERSDGRDDVPSLGGFHDLRDGEPQALCDVCIARRIEGIDDQDARFAARPALKHLGQWVSQSELRVEVSREQTVSGDEHDITTAALELRGQIEKHRGLAASRFAHHDERPYLCVLGQRSSHASVEPDLLPSRSNVGKVGQCLLGFTRVRSESSNVVAIAQDLGGLVWNPALLSAV